MAEPESDPRPADPSESKLSAAPCSRCGYNGPGYYQPETHPCGSESKLAEAVERLRGIIALFRGTAGWTREQGALPNLHQIANDMDTLLDSWRQQRRLIDEWNQPVQQSEWERLKAELAEARSELLETRGLYELTRSERDQARQDRDELDHRIAELRSANA